MKIGKTYYDIEKGTCLLEQIKGANTLSWRLLTRSGEWKDGTKTAIDYIVSFKESEWDEISPAAAAQLAGRLGGSL